jgi:hypothetical protein
LALAEDSRNYATKCLEKYKKKQQKYIEVFPPEIPALCRSRFSQHEYE